MLNNICNVEQIKFNIFETPKNTFKCIALLEDIEACKCQINVDGSTWTISSWYTNKDYQHKGIGTKTLKQLLQHLYSNFGCPMRIEYIWNGANEYVYEWLEVNFGALSKCPLAVQKTQTDDDWDSHIYYLNVEKVIKYFEL